MTYSNPLSSKLGLLDDDLKMEGKLIRLCKDLENKILTPTGDVAWQWHVQRADMTAEQALKADWRKWEQFGPHSVWAKKQGQRAVGQPGNIIMSGGTKSTEELIASTKKGILVTRTWYIRMVDPQTVLLTGLTRDGTFYIENGKIKHPVKNFRFNESPVSMLNNIEELGRPEVLAGDESQFQLLIPAMKVRDFNFTSLSDAV